LSTAPHRLGKYEFQQFLGKGNVGKVWKARDLSNKREVALKTVYADFQRSDPQFLTRFITDGQVLTTMRHAHLVPILEVNVKRQEESNEITAYLAMDYIVGQTFATYLQNTSYQSNFPPLSEISNFFTSLGLALDYAYQREIVHGNLTPSNILLNQQDASHFPGGAPVLTDIGLAQILGSATNTYTKAPLYLSPEQAQGYPPSQRSDVYALGVLLYEIYTGTVPFRGENSTATMSQHVHALPTPPTLINPIIPSALSEVILRAIAKDPLTRFPTVSAFAAAIADAYTIQSSFSLSEQQLREDIATSSLQENSLLGVAQPPLQPKSLPSHYSGKPSLSGLTLREGFGHTSALSSSPLQAPQPLPPNPLSPETKKVAEAPKLQSPLVTPAGQIQAEQTQTVQPETLGSIEPKKSNAQTQAFSLSALSQALPNPNPDANASQSVNRPDRPALNAHHAPFSPAPVAQVLQTPQPLLPRQTRPLQREAQPVQPIPPLPAQVMPATPRQYDRKKSSRSIALVALLVFVIVGGTLGAILLSNKGNGNPAASSNSSNRIFFQDGSLHNDQLHIDMQNIAPPPDGQTYFVWLQDTAQQLRPLGALSVQNGKASFMYQGDSKHTNLISLTQGVLITTEDVGKTPQGPSDHKVYQASFDPQLSEGLRNLLYATPGLPGQQSVVATLEDTLHSIDDKAGSIVDTLGHDNGQVVRQATRIIELLDNTQQAQKSGDLPTRYSPQVNATIGLLSSPSQKGYLDILDSQLKQLESQVAHNADAQQHLTNIKSALGDLKDWLQKMHDYDVQLLKAADLQDPGISGIALQLKQVSADSFTGHTIPPNASPQPIAGSAGAKQAYTEAQYIATLSLQPV
jgi:serine/threonine protein kinase